MQITRKEVTDALKELELALLESIEATEAEDKAKLRKMKAHCRVRLARDTVRALQVN